ncbi:TDP-N-acetylfucosamine:lipid II N-acetylfucosaminyltransferase, partial [Klebsiella pneumoniae]
MYYTLRRIAQARLWRVLATRGDLIWFSNLLSRVSGVIFYLPTRMDPSLITLADIAQRGFSLTI